MFIILPVCHKDHAQAVNLLELSLKLKFQTDHTLIVMYPQEASPYIPEVLTAAKRAFKTVIDYQIPAEVAQGWPEGPNAMFFHAISYLQQPNQIDREVGVTEMDFAQPTGRFLWLEPDSVPLHPTWLERMETAYTIGGKPFFGTRVPTYTYSFPPKRDAEGNIVKNENERPIPNKEEKPTSRVDDGQHMCGVGIYPRAFPSVIDWWRSCLGSDRPFDQLFQHEILKRVGDGGYYACTDTHLISHNTGATNYLIQRQDDGIFIVSDSHPKFPCGSAKFIWSPDGSIGAVLAHGCKDNSLIRVSMELNGLLKISAKEATDNFTQRAQNEAYNQSLQQGGQLAAQQAANQVAITTGYMRPQESEDITIVDPEYAQYLEWKASQKATTPPPKPAKPKKVKVTIKRVPKELNTEEIITHLMQPHSTWGGTLALYKVSPKILKPLFEEAKRRKAALLTNDVTPVEAESVPA